MNNSNIELQQKDTRQTGIPIESIIKRTLAYWPLVILALILSYIVSHLYLRYTPKVHKVQARLVINDDDQGQSTNLLRFQLDGSGYYNEVEKEVELLKSRSIIAEVVKKLSLQAKINQEGNVITSELYGAKSPIRLVLYEPHKVLQNVMGQLQVTKDNVVQFNGMSYPADSIINSPFGLIKWEVSGEIKLEDKISLQIITLKQAVNAVRGYLTVAPINKQSAIIDIIVMERIPERGEDLIAALLEVYNKNYVEFKRRIAQNTVEFIDERLNLLATELSSIEKNLEDFKSKSGVIDLSYEGQLFLSRVSEYDQQISQIDVQLQVLKELQAYVARRNNEERPVPATLGLQDPMLQSLLTQLFNTEFEYSRLKGLSGSKNPRLDVLQTQIDNLKPSILESIENLERSLVNNRAKLITSNRSVEQALKGIPQKERMLLDISRQQTIKNSIYTFLLQKREEAAIQSASIVPSNRIIDDPETLGKVKPKTNLTYLLSAGAFLLLTAIYVFFKEFANSKFQYKNEIEEEVGLPIIGELELVEDEQTGDGVVVTRNNRDIINEQFRELRTNISFLKKGKLSQSILFTSSKSGEGKSFVSTNLAISLAQAGKNVVLLEMDLRKPKVQQYLGIQKGLGITSYLINYASLDSIISKVPNIENLSVIGSGPLPPNPAEIILNEKIDELFDYMRKTYDYIVI
ncbi:MAG: GumC family protein, partial [Ignavibacterium sp.]